MTESEEKAKLLKDALKIVDELSKLHPYDAPTDEEDVEILIVKANKLTRKRLWKLN